MYGSLLLEKRCSLFKIFIPLSLSEGRYHKKKLKFKKGEKEYICSKAKWLFLSISSSVRHEKRYSKGLELNDFLGQCWKLVIFRTRCNHFLSIFHSQVTFQYYCKIVLRKTIRFNSFHKSSYTF